MPGKKRKGAAAGGTNTKMWGSSSPTSSSNDTSSSRRKASSSRRVGGGAVVVTSSGGNDSKVEKMFEEICDEDNPDAASMEGKKYEFVQLYFWIKNLTKLSPPLSPQEYANSANSSNSTPWRTCVFSSCYGS